MSETNHTTVEMIELQFVCIKMLCAGLVGGAWPRRAHLSKSLTFTGSDSTQQPAPESYPCHDDHN